MENCPASAHVKVVAFTAVAVIALETLTSSNSESPTILIVENVETPVTFVLPLIVVLLRVTGPVLALKAPWNVAAADTITSSRIDCPSTSKYPEQAKLVNPVYPVVLIPCGGAEYMLVKYCPSPWKDVAVS